MNVTEHEHEPNILGVKKGSDQVMIQNECTVWINLLIINNNRVTYIEGVEEYEQWDLYHAHLHSNAAAHFKAVDKKNLKVELHLYNGSVRPTVCKCV